MALFERTFGQNIYAESDRTEITQSVSLNLMYPPFLSRVNLESSEGRPLNTLHLECVLQSADSKQYEFRSFILETPVSSKRKMIPSSVPSPLTKLLIDDDTLISVGASLLDIRTNRGHLKLTWAESHQEENTPLQEIAAFLN